MASTSPFFRLPREMRDLIYEYYVFEENGYVYDATTNKLRIWCPAIRNRHEQGQDHTKPICLAFGYTCKRVASEMRGVALRTNIITFKTLCSPQEEKSFRGVRSKAVRFACVQEYLLFMKMDMLRHAATCLTPDIHRKLENEYPDLAFLFSEPLLMANERGCEWDLPASPNNGAAMSHTFRDALQSALMQAAAKQPLLFKALAGRAFDLDPKDIPPALVPDARAGHLRRPAFHASSQKKILSWNLQPWSTPTENVLCSVERHLTRARRDYVDRDLHKRVVKSKHYFSAAAVAIEFFKAYECAHLLRRVILLEDNMSVSNAECHARGLMHIFSEHSKVHIERRVGPYENMFVPGDCRTMDSCLDALILWMDEINQLEKEGVSQKSFTLALRRTCDSMDLIWEKAKLAASLQEAMAQYLRDKDIKVPPQWREFGYGLHHFLMPCHLPISFSQAIRDIVLGRSMIRYEGEAGDIWDSELVYEERRQWSLDEWRREWSREFLVKNIKSPVDWMDRCRRAYIQST